MSLVLIGSGPGIGLAVAKIFAQKRFSKIALLARSSAKLDEAKEAVISAASSSREGNGGSMTVRTYAVDISNGEALLKTLEATLQDLGSPECVYFNAARVQPSSFFDTTVEELEMDYKITTTALYVTAKWAIPLLKEAEKPALLVTNSLLYQTPETFVVSLTITKTSQRSLVMLLDKEFGKEVHIGLINVDGPVASEMKFRNPTYIAEKAWEIYAQEKGSWESEILIQE